MNSAKSWSIFYMIAAFLFIILNEPGASVGCIIMANLHAGEVI